MLKKKFQEVEIKNFINNQSPNVIISADEIRRGSLTGPLVLKFFQVH